MNSVTDALMQTNHFQTISFLGKTKTKQCQHSSLLSGHVQKKLERLFRLACFHYQQAVLPIILIYACTRTTSYRVNWNGLSLAAFNPSWRKRLLWTQKRNLLIEPLSIYAFWHCSPSTTDLMPTLQYCYDILLFPIWCSVWISQVWLTKENSCFLALLIL